MEGSWGFQYMVTIAFKLRKIDKSVKPTLASWLNVTRAALAEGEAITWQSAGRWLGLADIVLHKQAVAALAKEDLASNGLESAPWIATLLHLYRR